MVTDEFDDNGTPDDASDDVRFVDVISFGGGVEGPGSISRGIYIDLTGATESGPRPSSGMPSGQAFFGIENVIGSNRRDTIIGNDEDNVILSGPDALTSSDLIYGGGGDDVLVNGNAQSVQQMFGGDGDDVLFMGARPDRLSSGFNEAPDTIHGGDDSLTSGAGSIFKTKEDGSTSLAGDVLSFASERPNGLGSTTVGVGPVAVTINLAVSNPAFLPGTSPYAPVSYVRYNAGSKAVDVIGIEHIIGSDGADSLTGDDGINVLSGEGGDDIIDGGGNDDVLSGGDGDDVIFGGAGNDSVSGSVGTDSLFGGTGGDLLDFSSNALGLTYDARMGDAGTGKIDSTWEDEDGTFFTSSALLDEGSKNI